MAAMLVLWLAAAGAAGALARFFLCQAFQTVLDAAAPAGPLAANVVGCALFGLVLELAAGGVIGPQVKLVLLVGFLGSFTTFSTYAADVLALVQADRLAAACGWLFAHNALGFAALLAGVRVARWLP